MRPTADTRPDLRILLQTTMSINAQEQLSSSFNQLEWSIAMKVKDVMTSPVLSVKSDSPIFKRSGSCCSVISVDCLWSTSKGISSALSRKAISFAVPKPERSGGGRVGYEFFDRAGRLATNIHIPTGARWTRS